MLRKHSRGRLCVNTSRNNMSSLLSCHYERNSVRPGRWADKRATEDDPARVDVLHRLAEVEDGVNVLNRHASRVHSLRADAAWSPSRLQPTTSRFDTTARTQAEGGHPRTPWAHATTPSQLSASGPRRRRGMARLTDCLHAPSRADTHRLGPSLPATGVRCSARSARLVPRPS